LKQFDSETEVLTLNDLSDQTMMMLHKLIYADPKERSTIFKQNRKNGNLLNIILLPSKYDIGFMDDVLKTFLQSKTFNIAFAGSLWETLKSHNLHEHANIVFAKHTSRQYLKNNTPKLPSSVPILMAYEMMTNCTSTIRNGSVRKKWIDQFIAYSQDATPYRNKQDMIQFMKVLHERLEDQTVITQKDAAELFHKLLLHTVNIKRRY
jgi:hypothetical protein